MWVVVLGRLISFSVVVPKVVNICVVAVLSLAVTFTRTTADVFPAEFLA